MSKVTEPSILDRDQRYIASPTIEQYDTKKETNKIVDKP